MPSLLRNPSDRGGFQHRFCHIFIFQWKFSTPEIVWYWSFFIFWFCHTKESKWDWYAIQHTLLCYNITIHRSGDLIPDSGRLCLFLLEYLLMFVSPVDFHMIYFSLNGRSFHCYCYLYRIVFLFISSNKGRLKGHTFFQPTVYCFFVVVNFLLSTRIPYSPNECVFRHLIFWLSLGIFFIFWFNSIDSG